MGRPMGQNKMRRRAIHRTAKPRRSGRRKEDLPGRVEEAEVRRAVGLQAEFGAGLPSLVAEDQARRAIGCQIAFAISFAFVRIV